jgi:hypothetical protein
MAHWMGRTVTRTLHQALRLRRQARASRVPEVDRLREQVAYFKFWQGVAVVTDISVLGWLVSGSDDASHPTVMLAVMGVLLLTVGIAVLHRHIGRRIEQIGKL